MTLVCRCSGVDVTASEPSASRPRLMIEFLRILEIVYKMVDAMVDKLAKKAS